MRLFAALLSGPLHQPARAAGRCAVLATLPLMLLAFAVAVACLVAAFGQPSGSLLHSVLHVATLAADATAGCLLLALPASLASPGLGWLVLAWLALCVGSAGWSIIALPPEPFAAVIATAMLLLPVMVIGLGAAWSKLLPGTWDAAAGLGARWPAIVLASMPAAWPIIVRTCLVIFALAAGLLASAV